MSHAFCRIFYNLTMADVWKLDPNQKSRSMHAWAYDFGDYKEVWRDSHIYWSGTACCKWDAKARAWGKWVDEKVGTLSPEEKKKWREYEEEQFNKLSVK